MEIIVIGLVLFILAIGATYIYDNHKENIKQAFTPKEKPKQTKTKKSHQEIDEEFLKKIQRESVKNNENVLRSNNRSSKQFPFSSSIAWKSTTINGKPASEEDTETINKAMSEVDKAMEQVNKVMADIDKMFKK